MIIGQSKKPLKVKVRRRKKPEGRVEVGSNSISFCFDGEKIVFFNDATSTMTLPLFIPKNRE